MRALRTLAVAGLAALTPVVGASPIVTEWNYTVTSAFLTGTTVFTAGTGATTNTSNLLAWGNAAPASQSQLEIIGSPATDCANQGGAPNAGCGGVVPTGPISTTISPALPSYPAGEIGLTQTFIHRNKPIDINSKFLDEVDVETTLLLNPLSPVDNAALPLFPALTFNVNFKETPNSGPCVDGALNPCPDIFVIGGGLDNFSFWYNTDTAALSLVDPLDSAFNPYFVQIFPFVGTTPLVTLSNDACAAAGAANGCQGFFTKEGADNSVQFAFALTTRPIREVPEPGMLALFALGLVGLGFSIRRRQV